MLSMFEVKKRILPDYLALARYLVSPFLEKPDSLSIDCELINNNKRVWIRLAFMIEDRGKVYGRGGRNIQAIRTLLQTSARLADQTLNLEIYDDSQSEKSRETEKSSKKPRNPPPSLPSPQLSNK